MEKVGATKLHDVVTVPFNHLLSLGRPVKMVPLLGLSNMVTGIKKNEGYVKCVALIVVVEVVPDVRGKYANFRIA